MKKKKKYRKGSVTYQDQFCGCGKRSVEKSIFCRACKKEVEELNEKIIKSRELKMSASN